MADSKEGVILGEIAEAPSVEPTLDKMKSHRVMSQVMAKLLSEEHSKDDLLSQMTSSVGGLSKKETEVAIKRSLKRPRSTCGDNSDDEEEKEKDEKQEKDETTTEVISRVGMPFKRGTVPAEKTDVVKSCHVLPSASALERERVMQRVATKAVVQLFNAVSKHQKEIESKLKDAGKSERKKTKILSSVDKKDFLSHLKTSSQPHGTDEAEPSDKQPLWSVLRDDFTKGSKLKDWDKVDQSGTTELGGSDSDTDESNT